VDLVQAISPDEVASPRQLANAHTIFNAVNTVVFLALLTPMVALVRRIVRARSRTTEGDDARTGLHGYTTATAAVGLDTVAEEVRHLAAQVGDFLDTDFPAVAARPVAGMPSDESIEERKSAIRYRHRAIVTFLAELSHSSLDEAQSRQLLGLLSQADELAHDADILGSAFRRVARRRRRAGTSLSEESAGALVALQHLVRGELERAMNGATLPALGEEVEAQLESLATARLLNVGAGIDVDRHVVESDLADLLGRLALSAARLSEMRASASR
ncbi:MAG: hypothetical protein Q8L05_06245, partial [Actinomycetota bacterium]|nr:hypothetical protein [Actinomycetota bacterium]